LDSRVRKIFEEEYEMRKMRFVAAGLLLAAFALVFVN
jgi:hypothetical protein